MECIINPTNVFFTIEMYKDDHDNCDIYFVVNQENIINIVLCQSTRASMIPIISIIYQYKVHQYKIY